MRKEFLFFNAIWYICEMVEHLLQSAPMAPKKCSWKSSCLLGKSHNMNLIAEIFSSKKDSKRRITLTACSSRVLLKSVASTWTIGSKYGECTEGPDERLLRGTEFVNTLRINFEIFFSRATSNIDPPPSKRNIATPMEICLIANW